MKTHKPEGGIFPYHLLVLCQHQVVSTQRNTKNNGGDSFKTVDPLLSLRALASHIKHSAKGTKQRRYILCVCAPVGEGGHDERQHGEADREQGMEEDVSRRMPVKEEGRRKLG